MSDSFYQHHVFICTNVRDDGRACCAERGAQRAQEHAKKRVKQLNLNGQGKVRNTPMTAEERRIVRQIGRAHV